MRAALMHRAGDVRVEDVSEGYRLMAEPDALKVLVRP